MSRATIVLSARAMCTARNGTLGLALGCLLAACAHRTPPHLYPEPVPALPDPTPITWVPDGTECPNSIGVEAGDPMPYVDAEGNAVCSVALVTQATLTRLLAAEADAELWRTAAGVCVDERERERRAGQVAYDACHDSTVGLRRDLLACKVGGALSTAAVVGACVATRP